jgi:hypothetical protein
VVKLYYEKFPDIRNCSPLKFQEQMKRAMEQVRKDHYSAFCRHLLVCDISMGSNFLKEIHVHYDMNLELEMLIEKL